MGNENPDTCCGVSVDCCPDNQIPDRLTLTATNNCGTVTIPLADLTHTIEEGFESWKWSGKGSVTCRFNPDDPCDQVKPVDVFVMCENAAWFLSFQGCFLTLDEVICEPFFASASCSLEGCDDYFDIDVTT